MPDRPPPFLVGDHPALDFLNTVATPVDLPVEWLQDGRDLVDWLEAAGMLDAARAVHFRGAKRVALDETARKARDFREWLRAFVGEHLGKPVRAAALAPLNALLATDTSYPRVVISAGTPALVRERRWESPDELLLPVAEAAADLICGADPRLVRACEGHNCTLLFLDRTKSHARRWCSMAVCGNRAKAAAHRSRKRDA